MYIPLYDYYKKVPVSFIFLSAGVDGKMDNEIAPSDTLYLNNWWAKLDVYNYEEAILLQDFCERWDETSNVFGEVESLDYYPPYPDIPRFRMTDYLWGKKDWIVQLGPLTGLYLYRTYSRCRCRSINRCWIVYANSHADQCLRHAGRIRRCTACSDFYGKER